MPNSHITNFVNAVVNKASTLINSHNNSDDAHSSLFSAKANAEHSHSYNELSNKPTIPSANSTATNIKMDGTQSAGSLSTFAKADHVHPTDTSRAAATHNHTKSQITDFPTIPSKTSQLTNDSGFLTSHQSLSNYYNKSETNNYDVDFILGTQTASTSAWTGTTDVISSLREGTTIFYKLPYASTSTNVTLNLTLKGGGTTGAKNVFYKNTSRVTTHFGVGQVVGLTYDGTAWYVISPSDNNSNNDNNYGGIQFKAGEALTTQTICCAKDNGQYYKVANGVVLDIRYPLIMTSSAVTSGTTTNTMYRTWYAVNIANTKSMTLTNGSQLFLEGTAYSDGKFTISSNVVTHTLTNGRYYIKVGTALSTTQIRFISDMTVYYYNGTTLKPAIKKEQIVDFPTSMTPTSHASTATTYGASSASNYGHAMASSTSPKANGTAAVGSETAKFARGDHVHPHNCVNNLTSTSTTAPLAANQGKVLKDSLAWTQVAQPVTGITLYANDYLCMCVIDYDSASVAINTGKLDSNADAFPSAYRPPQRVAVPNTYGTDANSYSIDVFVDTDGFVKTRSVRAWSSITVRGVLMWGRI